MPTYVYRCVDPDCFHEFESVKPMAEIDSPETCPKCNCPGAWRTISRTHFYGASDWDKAEFNPGLGCVTKNSRHRKEIAKRKGLEEVGNETTDTMIKHFDAQREKKLADRWASV